MKPKSRIVKRIQQASQLILQAPPTLAELAFTPRELVQATLPHRDPGNVPVWVRRNGHYGLSIQPGWDIARNCSVGYPYGAIPRLLVFWLTAEALRVKQRRIEMSESLTGFMELIGLNPRNGTDERSDRFRFRDQSRRLFKARISFQYWGEINGKRFESSLDMLVAPKTHLWWTERDAALPVEIGSWIELSEEFFHAITQNPVPLDFRALQALKNSPFAIDVYSWATLRAYAAQQKDKPHTVTWALLLNQFGAAYQDVKDFRKNFKLALEKVQSVYPWFQFEYIRGGIIIKPSLPTVRCKSSLKKSLLPDNQQKISVSSKAFEEAAFIIANAGTGWCKYALERQFYEYAEKKGTPKNVDKAFLGFVRKKVVQRP